MDSPMKGLSRDQIMMKWSPVIEHLGVKDELKKEKICMYAHYHALNESDGTLMSPTASEPFGRNLLPISLNVLLQIKDFSKVVISPSPMAQYVEVIDNEAKVIMEGVKTYSFKIQVDRNHLDDLEKMWGIDILQETEHIVITEIANRINELIDNGHTIHLYKAVDSVKLRTKDVDHPTLNVTTRFFPQPPKIKMEKSEGITIDDL